MNKNIKILKPDRSLPKLASAKFLKDHILEVLWSKGDRCGKTDRVNLLALIDTFKAFKGLRKNRVLLEHVHIVYDGAAIGFGDHNDFEVAAITIERLVAEQTMRQAQAHDNGSQKVAGDDVSQSASPVDWRRPWNWRNLQFASRGQVQSENLRKPCFVST